MDFGKTSRREVLKGLGAISALTGFPATRALAASKTVKIGVVGPQTGPLAFFYEQVPFVMDAIAKTIGPTVSVGGVPHSIEFVVKDSQSSPNRAAEVAQDLILNNKVDMMLAFATPATVNPVADQCEVNGVPCLTNDTPLESYFFGRGGDPKTGFEWTYHFSFSGADMVASWESMWAKLKIDNKVGLLFPNDPDGINMSKVVLGTAPPLGFSIQDAGRFDLPGGNYASQIAAFRKADVAIVAGALTPPDFTSFWIAAAQQGFSPKCVTVGKALEFPHAIESLGSRAIGLSVGCWWDPTRPFSSGLTGQSARALTDAYEAASGKQWTMTLGDRHAIFEVLVDVLKRAESAEPAALRDAIKATDYHSIVGAVNFAKGPFPNTCATPQTTGQWIKGAHYPLDFVIVDNSRAPMGAARTRAFLDPERLMRFSLNLAEGQFGREPAVARVEAPPLHLEELAKSFNAVAVLVGVNLTLSKGEILGVLGPNGAGKSTLFNLIAGVVPPSGGSIHYFGHDVAADRPWTRARAGLGRTFQVPKPFARTTVYENVLIAATHGRGIGVRRGMEIAGAVLQRTGLYTKRALLARELSLLDLKRLELAKALSTGPRILLLDEIAGGLTDAECDALLAIVHEVHAEGVAVLWIEHVLHILSRAATRLAVLSGGRILATGEPAAIIADPRVREVYIGA